MQTCSVEVALGGDKLNTVFRENVTPPEVLILQRIHGKHSVEFRGEVDEKKHNHQAEIQRLRERYHTKDTMGTRMPVFDALFPGAAPQLPIRFAEIGFGHAAEPAEIRILPDKIKTEAAPVAKKAAKKGAKKAAKVADTAEDDEDDQPADEPDDWNVEVGASNPNTDEAE